MAQMHSFGQNQSPYFESKNGQILKGILNPSTLLSRGFDRLTQIWIVWILNKYWRSTGLLISKALVVPLTLTPVVDKAGEKILFGKFPEKAKLQRPTTYNGVPPPFYRLAESPTNMKIIRWLAHVNLYKK